MLDIIKFIFQCIAQLISILFEIDLGFTSLGIFMCIIFVLFPLILGVINILKFKMKGD